MFENLPQLHRKDREISEEECIGILQRAEYMVMATADMQGVPYAVPLSFVYLQGKIYFHSGMHKGHKISNLMENPRCSLAVVGNTQPIYTKNFTTYFESVVIFGTVRELVCEDEKKAVLFALAEKYLPEHMDKAEKDISASLSRTAVYEILPEKICGKAKRAK